eukprot:5326104-Prymnesium_polylepis.1
MSWALRRRCRCSTPRRLFSACSRRTCAPPTPRLESRSPSTEQPTSRPPARRTTAPARGAPPSGRRFRSPRFFVCSHASMWRSRYARGARSDRWIEAPRRLRSHSGVTSTDARRGRVGAAAHLSARCGGAGCRRWCGSVARRRGLPCGRRSRTKAHGTHSKAVAARGWRRCCRRARRRRCWPWWWRARAAVEGGVGWESKMSKHV